MFGFLAPGDPNYLLIFRLHYQQLNYATIHTGTNFLPEPLMLLLAKKIVRLIILVWHLVEQDHGDYSILSVADLVSNQIILHCHRSYSLLTLLLSAQDGLKLFLINYLHTCRYLQCRSLATIFIGSGQQSLCNDGNKRACTVRVVLYTCSLSQWSIWFKGGLTFA